ncbi:MAG: hypothetical protein OEZ43_15765 [Gammaproteobacteria bacterium]|nr:hypothetical protein [Gammaproteobacteria bacterium]
MKKMEKVISKSIYVFALSSVCNLAMANTIWLSASGEEVTPGTAVEIDALQGGQVQLDVWFDFTEDATVGGGVDLVFDPSALSFSSLAFNDSLTLDPEFTGGPGSTFSGEIIADNSFMFGYYNGLTAGRVATLTFDVLGEQGTSTSLDMMTNDQLAGNFFSAITGNEQVVNYYGATVAVVPEMEVWAMMLAGVGLIGWKARRTSNSNRTI